MKIRCIVKDKQIDVQGPYATSWLDNCALTVRIVRSLFAQWAMALSS